MRLRAEWAAAALIGTAYIIVCTQVGAILYGDYPDHFVRAVAIHDLLLNNGARFGAIFEFRWMPLPYLLGDLLLVGAIQLFGTHGATTAWTIANLLALPLAIIFYLHIAGLAVRTRALFFIVSLFLSTDWFFICGFLNFHLAVAMVIFAFALAQVLRSRPSLLVFSVYAVTVFLGYLMHLAFAVFLAAALGGTALWRMYGRTIQMLRETSLFVPIGLTLAWHVASTKIFPDAVEVVSPHFIWGSLSGKLRRADWDLVRLNEHLDLLMAGGLFACLLFLARRGINRQTLTKSPPVEMLVLTAAFIALYFGLPMRYGDPTYLDVRALALAGPFAIFALLMVLDNAAGLGQLNLAAAYGVSIAVAVGNLIYLGSGLSQQEKWLTEYRVLTNAIPSKALVLDVTTRIKEGQWRPNLHAAPLAVVLDRDALIPDMFSGDRGSPMKYFRYRNRPYTPPNDWYLSTTPVELDWNAIACSYDFVLITKPFDPQHIRLSTHLAAENSSGALLKVNRDSCLN